MVPIFTHTQMSLVTSLTLYLRFVSVGAFEHRSLSLLNNYFIVSKYLILSILLGAFEFSEFLHAQIMLP